ncbi:unnamed protein product [Amoebophrya sp. A25]|nr:unnamed protein product [Amoebophrya sp. A25]|eukprot:GSA25T00020968001.1
MSRSGGTRQRVEEDQEDDLMASSDDEDRPAAKRQRQHSTASDRRLSGRISASSSPGSDGEIEDSEGVFDEDGTENTASDSQDGIVEESSQGTPNSSRGRSVSNSPSNGNLSSNLPNAGGAAAGVARNNARGVGLGGGGGLVSPASSLSSRKGGAKAGPSPASGGGSKASPFSSSNSQATPSSSSSNKNKATASFSSGQKAKTPGGGAKAMLNGSKARTPAAAAKDTPGAKAKSKAVVGASSGSSSSSASLFSPAKAPSSGSGVKPTRITKLKGEGATVSGTSTSGASSSSTSATSTTTSKSATSKTTTSKNGNPVVSPSVGKKAGRGGPSPKAGAQPKAHGKSALVARGDSPSKLRIGHVELEERMVRADMVQSLVDENKGPDGGGGVYIPTSDLADMDESEMRSVFDAAAKQKKDYDPQIDIKRLKDVPVKISGVTRIIHTASGLYQQKVAEMEIKLLQKNRDRYLLPKRSFRLCVREAQELAGWNGRKWTTHALLLLQKVMEESLTLLSSNSLLLASHANRVTLKARDLSLMKRLRENVRKDVKRRCELP